MGAAVPHIKEERRESAFQPVDPPDRGTLPQLQVVLLQQLLHSSEVKLQPVTACELRNAAEIRLTGFA